MSDSFNVDGENFETDALKSAIKSYRDAVRSADQDLDFDFFIRTLRSVNERSAVKIARNPIDENRDWVAGTVLYNIGKVEIDEEYHLSLHIRRDKVELSAEKMLDQIEKLKKKMRGVSGPVMLVLSDDKKVRLTDVYSHAFVRDVYAGVPFDVVLGYFE